MCQTTKSTSPKHRRFRTLEQSKQTSENKMHYKGLLVRGIPVLYVIEDFAVCSVWLQHIVKEPEIKLPTSAGSSKKQESFRKTSISALLTMPKPLTVWITL